MKIRIMLVYLPILKTKGKLTRTNQEGTGQWGWYQTVVYICKYRIMNFTILDNYNAAIKILEKDKPEHSFSSLPKDQKQLSYNFLPLVFTVLKNNSA